MVKKVSEKEVEEYFKKKLDERGVFHFKGNPMNLKGYPDRLVFANEIHWVEIKVGKEGGSYYKQTPTQKFWEKKIKKSKGNYTLLTGKKEVDLFIEKIAK